MSMVQGEVDVHNYHYLKCNKPENQNVVVGMDCLAGATQIDMERIGTMHCVPGGDVNTVDKLQTIHQIENADPARSGCISLHVYSPPIDSCVAFDLEHQSCFRRTLRYTSEYGVMST
jgi:cysteine dioxygenase